MGDSGDSVYSLGKALCNEEKKTNNMLNDIKFRDKGAYICRTPKCDGYAKVRWSRLSAMVRAKVQWYDALKCDGIPYKEETLEYDGLTR